jgi:Domain of unknown function DUF29
MVVKTLEPLAAIYERDETAWLDIMASLIREGRVEDLDLPNLAEFLSDMAGRDRREVESRMVVLLAHLLKWSHQPERRSRSWRATIIEQRQQLNRHASRGVLRNHAESVLPQAYADAVERAAAETGLPPEKWPADCPYTFEQLLTIELREEID